MHNSAEQDFKAGVVDAASAREVAEALHPGRVLDRTHVVGAHAAALYARALWLTRSRADAWDLVQDSLEHALRASNQSVPSEKTRSWLLVILHNLFLDRSRAQRKWVFRPLTDELAGGLPVEQTEATRPWEELDEVTLSASVGSLPVPLRPAFQMHLAGKSYAEIARALGIPVGTVGTRIHRARRRLREMLAVVGGLGGGGGEQLGGFDA